MKRILFIVVSVILLYNCISAQENDLIVVKAGTKLLDYFPVSERYMYSEFIPGRIIHRNGGHSDRNLNYNYVAGEVEFIQRTDTLSIANKKEIKMILIAQDTFYYDKGYIEIIRKREPKIGLKQFVELKEIVNKDPYGTASSGGATTSYNSMPANGSYYKFTANKDMIFKKTLQYYLASPENSFVLFNKKNLLNLYPQNKDKIKSYLKKNKVKFDSREDLFKLADFIESL
ncbi:MAG TPA: hypothetical protein VMV47_16715 [Bacteroidales bacterium]|nr:hypothetical protein [Bacteroidales bacterium]